MERLLFLNENRQRPHTCLTQGFVCQDSCACTRFLCMHNTLVHAQHFCACTGGAWDQGRDPKKSSRGSGPGRLLFLGTKPWALAPPVHAQECCACTGILCMHKNLVHAQYTFLFLHNKYCSETFHTRLRIFSFSYTYTVD